MTKKVGENLARCLAARELVEAHLDVGNGNPNDLHATLIDIVASVCHVARDEGFDVDALLSVASAHELAERAA